MNGFDELVDRLTSRLRVDPELRMDVANELLAHLEDSQAEYLAAGYTDDEAAANAAKALGDEADLARQLWQANRRRIRFRRVCKWAARVALVPGAIAVTLMVAWSNLPLVAVIGWQKHWGWCSGEIETEYGYRPMVHHWGLIRDLREDESMTDEQRLIVFGDFTRESLAEGQKALVERWPDDPVYYANYVAAYLEDIDVYLPGHVSFSDPEPHRVDTRHDPYGAFPPEDEQIDPAPEQQPQDEPDPYAEWLREDDMDLAEILAVLMEVLSHGEQIEPDNAYYNLVAAVELINASVTNEYYRDPWNMRPLTRPVIIENQAWFDEGIAQLLLAADKPRLRRHALEMMHRRLAVVPDLTRFADRLFWGRVLWEPFIYWGSGGPGPRLCVRVVAAYALQLAHAGSGEQAMRLSRALRIVAAKDAADAETVGDYQMADEFYALATANEAKICRVLGDERRAEALERESRSDRSQDDSAPSTGCATTGPITAGVPYALRIVRVYPLSGFDPTPARMAEYALVERAGLTVLLAIVSGLALLSGALTLIGLGRYRRGDERPKLLFVGWPRLGRICLWAVVVPLGLYGVYAHLSPVSGRNYAAWYVWYRVIFEFTLVGGLVVTLLLTMTYSAVRRRAADAGLDAPPPRRWRDRRIILALATVGLCAALGYVIARQCEGAGSRWDWEYTYYFTLRLALTWGYKRLIIALWLVLGAWICTESIRLARLKGGLAQFRRTLVRSSVGVLAAAVIVIGLFCGLALRHAEAAATRRITGPADFARRHDISTSVYSALQERHIRKHRELMAEWQQADRP